jgi:LysR family transcriptional activator of nhaA
MYVGAEVCRRYGVVRVGSLKGVRERFYAMSAERRLQDPAVVAITEAARDDLFGD